MTRAIRITTRYTRFSRFLLAAGILWFNVAFSDASLPSSSHEKTYCFFTPPAGWEIVDAHSLSPKVVIGFVEKSKKGFCPSLNLAIEPVKVTLSEYVQAVKKLHEEDRNTRWRDLGKLKTPGGVARLTEIDTKSKWGDVRILQMMLVEEGSAYVLTAAASKEDFAKFYSEIKKSFSSFSLTKDLLSFVNSDEKKEILTKKIHYLKNLHAQLPDEKMESTTAWISFKDYLIQEHKELGTFWQLQLLQSLKEEIDSHETAKDA